MFFIAKKSEKKNIERLLETFPSPLISKEGEKELGLLLSFPECCVEAHYKELDIGKGNKNSILPFASCTPECEFNWLTEYTQLAKKYNIIL